MTKFEGIQLQSEFENAFKIKIKELSLDQLWWLTKFAKHVRGRCRSNAAFNGYMNRNFAPATFEAVEKRNERTGETYTGLAINSQVRETE